MLVHGTMDRGGAFRRVTDRLTDVETVVLDRRGYARSRDLPVDDDAVAAGVADVLELLDDRPAVVVGHSFGGHVAAATAVAAPGRVGAVAVWEAPLAWLPWWPSDSAGAVAVAAGEPTGAADAFLRRMLGDRWDRLPPRARADRLAEGPALLADLRSIRDPARPPWTFDALAATGVAVVAGHGGASKPSHVRSARELADAVPGAELFVIDGAAHGAHVSHPDGFADFCRRALARARR